MRITSTIRKSQIVTAQVMLVFLGVALHSLFLIHPVLAYITGTGSNIFSIQFFVMYAVMMSVYSVVTSLYVVPNMVISPYYIQIGAVSVMILSIIYQITTNSLDLITNAQFLPIITLIFITFLLGGFGLGKFLRWLFGMVVEPDSFWLKTYRVDVEYSLIKKIFDDVRFNTYDIKELSPESLKLTRKFYSGVKILILAQVDPKSPTESIVSISSCDIRFETIWKTEEAHQALTSIRDQITGSLTHNYSRELIEDKEERFVSSQCQLLLLESFNSPLSKLGKIPRRSIFATGGLLGIALLVTIVSAIPQLQNQIELDTNSVVLTWVTMVSTILLLNSSQIKTTIQKIQRH